MRVKILKILVVLLFVGSSDARPQRFGRRESKTPELQGSSDAEWKAIAPEDVVPGDTRSNDTRRRSSDLQSIDQSLRTVATQLLNVTNPEDASNLPDVIPSTNLMKTGLITAAPNARNNSVAVEETSQSLASKFAHFESSHPGQAMAITEEELERELSSTRLDPVYKSRPTTTGGISTWILLNPPSTTIKTVEKVEESLKTKDKVTVADVTVAKPIEVTGKIETTTMKKEQKEKVTFQPTSTVSLEKIVTTTTKKPDRTTKKSTEVTEKTMATTNKPEIVRSTTTKTRRTTEVKEQIPSTTTASTLKKVQTERTTAKPKVSIPVKISQKPANSTAKRPTQQLKPTAKPASTTKKTTNKVEVKATPKVEKVTFKPVQTISIPKNKPEPTDKPMFVTKIKASMLTNAQKTTTTSKPSVADTSFVEVPVKSKPIETEHEDRPVSIIRVKKPLEEPTRIEIEPIQVNAPILKIEKVEVTSRPIEKPEENVPETTTISLKVDTEPQLTKVETTTKDSTSSASSLPTTTTKRPKHGSKRKRNKVRRRKPSSTSTTAIVSTTSTTTIAPTTLSLDLEELEELSTVPGIIDNDVQESKIAPESKVAPNSTKTKKKPVEKPISTQIYNYLSREVMPSLGVMSLVGFGIGLASYLLYPFGGAAAITRRNYNVEPHYKYDLDEYGGNYGQSEEEVLAKVYQGMKNHDNRYKDQSNDYYRYQHYEGAYEPMTTRRVEQKFSSASSPPSRLSTVPRRPSMENTPGNYRTTTSYYDRRIKPEFTVGHDNTGIRQFVVGNVPKDYPVFEKVPTLPTVENKPTYDLSTSQNFESGTVGNLGLDYTVPETQTPQLEDNYEEIEITPAAVAVEHGPRSLKVRRSVSEVSRLKRESVIQVIPSRHEIEEEEKEESLSNEILDIIDHALLPGSEDEKKKSTTPHTKTNEVEDLGAQKKKHEEKEKSNSKEITARGSEVVTVIHDPEDKLTTLAKDENNEIPHTDVVHEIGEEEPRKEETTTSSSASSSSTSDSEDLTHKEETNSSTEDNISDTTPTWFIDLTTEKPKDSQGFGIFDFVKRVAEIKLRLGITILKHASEGFARYLGHVQKRINGDE